MKKRLIIVCNEEVRKYATYLQQLVSALDDEDGEQVGVKDGSVEAVIWDEKRFNDNEYGISSSNKILFVGWNDTANMNTTNMSDSFSACGMHYGRLGNRAYMRVEADSLNADNQDEFGQLCEKYGKTFDDELNLKYSPSRDEELGNKPEDHAKAVAEAAAIPLIGPLGHAAAYAAAKASGTAFALPDRLGILADKRNDARQSSIAWDQQYNLLTLIFYLDGLSDFMEN